MPKAKDKFEAALETSGARLKSATDRYTSVMQAAQSRVDTVAEIRVQRRMDIMSRYIEMMKKVQELSALSGLPVSPLPKP